MQIIYKCNECFSENVDVVSTKFKQEIKSFQGDKYNRKVCEVLFICCDCGAGSEDEFSILDKIN